MFPWKSIIQIFLRVMDGRIWVNCFVLKGLAVLALLIDGGKEEKYWAELSWPEVTQWEKRRKLLEI